MPSLIGYRLLIMRNEPKASFARFSRVIFRRVRLELGRKPMKASKLLPLAALTLFVGCATQTETPPPTAGRAPGGQPKMQEALPQLQIAKENLLKAKPNKGGHRERALELVNQAINQVQQGEASAAGH